MKIWGMSTEEYTQLLEDSFTAIKKASRKAEAQHYVRTRILATNLELALKKIRGAAPLSSAPCEEKLCA